MFSLRDFAVMGADRRAGTAAAAVAEHGNVFAGLQPERSVKHGELSELDKMIAAAAGSKLGPGAIFVLLRDRADRPIGIQHVMLAAMLERGADAKPGLGFNRASEPILVPVEVSDRKIEHG